jgi:hypothetical protein
MQESNIFEKNCFLFVIGAAAGTWAGVGRWLCYLRKPHYNKEITMNPQENNKPKTSYQNQTNTPPGGQKNMTPEDKKRKEGESSDAMKKDNEACGVSKDSCATK